MIAKIASAEVLLIVLCIMNVLSALFVEMALQIKDRDLLIQARGLHRRDEVMEVI